MNERINELAEQAHEYANIEYSKWVPTNGYEGIPNVREIYTNKFAELMVLECANELIKWKDEPFPYDPEFGARLIKRHFGVE